MVRSQIASFVVLSLISTNSFGQPLPPPPAPPKKVADPRQIHRVAVEAGTDYAQRMVRSFGVASQVRYNFREGVLAQVREIGNHDDVSLVRSTLLYRENLSSGTAEGREAGRATGISDARYSANSLADHDINLAIDEAMASGRPIRFAPNPRLVPYSGARNPKSQPSGVLSRMEANRNSIRQELRNLLIDSVSDWHLDSLWRIESMYRAHDLSMPSDIGRSDSFSRWQRDSNSNHGEENAKRYLREISTSDYENPTQNRNLFERNFEEAYSNRLNGEWRPTVQDYNRGADSVGRDSYYSAATGFARDLGAFDGYAAKFTIASKRSFDESFISFYESSYESIKHRVMNSSYMTRISARILNSNSSNLNGTSGDFITVIVDQMSNRGMKDGVARILVQSGSLVRPLKEVSLPLKGLSRLSQPVAFEFMAQLIDVTAPDQTIPVNVTIADDTFSFSINATFEELLRRAGQVQNNLPFAQSLAEKAAGFMKVQWDDMSGWNDQYEKREPNMLLVRMRAMFDALADSEKTQMRRFGQIIRNAFGGKPSRLDTKRDDWESVRNMINEMGLEGKDPEYVPPPRPDPDPGGGNG